MYGWYSNVWVWGIRSGYVKLPSIMCTIARTRTHFTNHHHINITTTLLITTTPFFYYYYIFIIIDLLLYYYIYYFIVPLYLSLLLLLLFNIIFLFWIIANARAGLGLFRFDACCDATNTLLN